jgi:hypothetical protein
MDKGNSFANGPAAPEWLRKNWQTQLVIDSTEKNWRQP